jgi:hypothetical protein
VDADDSGGLITPGGRPFTAGRRRLTGRGPLRAVTVVACLVGALVVVVRPAAGVGPVSDPTLPGALPSLPLPTLPLATPKLPTLPPLPTPTLPPLTTPTPTLPTLPPLPTPTLPLPTSTLPLPTPTLPLPTPTLPIPSLPLSTSSAPPTVNPLPSTAGASSGPLASGAASAGPIVGGPIGSVTPTQVASFEPDDGATPAVGGQGFGSLVLPGLLIGVPTMIIVGILVAQLAVGAAWLPVIRRWLNRRV